MHMAYILGGLLIFIGKIFILVLLCSFSFFSFSNERLIKNNYFGVTQVFKAQVYANPDIKSQVLTHLNKGEKLTVHSKHFKEDEILNKYEDQQIDQFENKQGFYQVITSNGIMGYIEKTHVHLIYRDFRDQHYHFKTNTEEDLTDYRLTEPMPQNYPLARKNSYRLNFQASIGPSFDNNYVFPHLIKKERFSNKYGAAISFLKNATFDFEDRFYFGGILKFLTFQNNFTLTDNSTYKEDHLAITIGPALYYESVRLNAISVGHGLELSYIYRRADIDATSGNRSENRIFYAHMFEPSLVNQIIFKNLDKNLSFMMGMRISAQPKYELKARNRSRERDLWGTRDGFYELEAKVYQTYFIGLQIYY